MRHTKSATAALSTFSSRAVLYQYHYFIIIKRHSQCLGPGFTVLALGPGFRPIFIHSKGIQELHPIPPTAATQGDQPAAAVTTAAPPGSRWVPTGWRSKATSSTWAASRKGTGGRTGRSRAGSMQPARCSGSSKSQYSRPTTWTSNSKLHFYSYLVLSRLMYGAAESWALTGSQAAQL